MTNKLKHFIVAAAVLAIAAPASAKPGNGGGGGGGGNNGGGNNVTLLNANCNLATGCEFSGNIHDSGSAALTQAAYNAAKNPDITLDYLGASDAGFGSVTGGPTGTWSANGFLVDYIAVKSGPAFMLYSVTGGNFNYSTAGLQNGNNADNPGLSHLAFFGHAVTAVVPEPASWALMIGGFGFVGFASRRNRRQQSVLA